MVTEKTVRTYITVDGKEFTDYTQATEHEAKVLNRIPKAKADYINKNKLTKQQLVEYGTFEVRGEDPNCDFGGPHYNPFIGVVESTLEQAIEWAVAQPDWSSWGAGGSIKPITIIKL